MKIKPDQSKIEKLPVWAQEYIQSLERDRELSVRKYRELTDNQTESMFYSDDIICFDGSTKVDKHYYQANSITCYFNGLEVSVRPDIQWGNIKIYFGSDGLKSRKAVLSPVASNSIEILPHVDVLYNRLEGPKS